jgi:hypothetical protein
VVAGTTTGAHLAQWLFTPGLVLPVQAGGLFANNTVAGVPGGALADTTAISELGFEYIGWLAGTRLKAISLSSGE